MTKVKNFHEKIESDLARLGVEIKTQKMEEGAERREERETVKQSLRALSEKAQPVLPGVPQTPGVPAVSDDDRYLPSYMASAASGEEIKRAVEGLIELAFKRGIGVAISLARKTNPFVEDAFHDALVDKLLPELKKRGFID